MKVYLKEDIKNVGFAGEIVDVSKGYALNFLFPRKLAVNLTEANEKFYKNKVHTVENRKQALETETSMLAEKIKSLELSIKGKMHHEEGKEDRLYGSINAKDIVDALIAKGIKVSKSQIKIDKAIKKQGTHTVKIKLSSRLQPTLTIKVVSE